MKSAICAILSLLTLSIGAQTPLLTVETMQFPDENHTYQPGESGWGQFHRTSNLYGKRQIALTFDDGPHPTLTPRLLDILKKHNAQATFFVIAEKINSRTMPIIERMFKEGHFVASHDWDHTNNNRESRTTHKRGLTNSILKIKEAAHELGVNQKEMYYRYPYAAYGSSRLDYHHMEIMKEVSSELFMGENCINFAFWDIDTADWVGNMTSTNISNTVLAHLDGGTAYRFVKRNGRFVKSPYSISESSAKGGGIVLMHDIHTKTVNAVDILLGQMKDKNFEVVPLSSVDGFGYDDKNCVLAPQYQTQIMEQN